MKLRELVIAAACILLLMFGAEVYAQEAVADAASNQGQVQGQTQVGGIGTAAANSNQGQSQSLTGGGGGAGGSVSNSGNATVGFNNSFNGAEPIRYLPVPSALPIENYQATIFGSPDYRDKGADFVSMRQLIEAMNYVDLKADVAGEESIRVVTQMLIPLPEGHPKTPKDKSKITSKAPKVSFEINDGEAVNNGFKPIAVLSVQTKKPDKSNSASLAVKIGKVAAHMKADTVIFLTEGSSKKLYSSGWGIGFSYNYAQVNSDPSGDGSVGSGGFGYSQGEAGYKDLVYLTAIVGVRKAE